MKEVVFYDSIKLDILNCIEDINDREIIILAIGTDKIIGDCLGPLTGEFLVEMNCPCVIYGTLKNPVDAKNLKNTLKIIEKNHKNPYVIAIDASVGNLDEINKIMVKKDSIFPGLGFKKKLPEVGDLSITGIVGTEEEMVYDLLNNLRLNQVYTMAKTISKAIIAALDESKLY
ncbi:spore protease YyaC [Clostridium senegalense]|uniref:spore protease YyaC n=1 Tax=Clostridium senegalense TaxID=1465809 RepID=UPI0003172826|nr:spore protease YyaC [Clostridium senegalense]